MIWYKQGVVGDLDTVTQKGLGRVAGLFESKGRDLYVTSKREGNHGLGSLHYIGKAFDIRGAENVSKNEICEVLGPGFDVVVESNHIHIEHDPKG